MALTNEQLEVIRKTAQAQFVRGRGRYLARPDDIFIIADELASYRAGLLNAPPIPSCPAVDHSLRRQIAYGIELSQQRAEIDEVDAYNFLIGFLTASLGTFLEAPAKSNSANKVTSEANVATPETQKCRWCAKMVGVVMSGKNRLRLLVRHYMPQGGACEGSWTHAAAACVGCAQQIEVNERGVLIAHDHPQAQGGGLCGMSGEEPPEPRE